MKLEYEKLVGQLKDCCVERPNKNARGNIAGHMAGEPFAKYIYQHLKQLYSANIFYQYEFLNDLYRSNPTVITAKDRYSLFQSPTVMFLLSRGVKETEEWRPENVFSEKQNDTADILFHNEGYFDLIDIKTTDRNKKGQPPNIISAYKLAKTCALMIDNADYDSFDMHYVSLDWEEQDDKLVCREVHYADLFKENPADLYINWAAALQIQFFVKELKQNWILPREAWAHSFILHFVKSAMQRSIKMKDDYVSPFVKYIDDKDFLAKVRIFENALEHVEKLI